MATNELSNAGPGIRDRIKAILAGVATYHRNQRDYRRLLTLDDQHLRDMGLLRFDIEQLTMMSRREYADYRERMW